MTYPHFFSAQPVQAVCFRSAASAGACKVFVLALHHLLARAKCLFSFRGIAGGARGSDIGEIVGMGVGAAVGAAIGEQADKKAEERSEKRRSPYEQQPTDESGFDENNGGDDRIFDFNGTGQSVPEKNIKPPRLGAKGSENLSKPTWRLILKCASRWA